MNVPDGGLDSPVWLSPSRPRARRRGRDQARIEQAQSQQQQGVRDAGVLRTWLSFAVIHTLVRMVAEDDGLNLGGLDVADLGM